MNVASLENCKRLYKLSGWSDTLVKHITDEHTNLDERLGVVTVYEKMVGLRDDSTVGCDECEGEYSAKYLPTYDLGYLLRKLPDDMHSLAYEVTYRLNMKKIDETYFFDYSNQLWWRDNKAKFTRAGYDSSDESLAYGIMPVCAGTPEDAAALLAIALFEQGVLTKD